MEAEFSLTARWVVPVATPPIPGGIVVVRDSLIVAVDPAGTRRADLDLGNAAVLPGLVNAHAHLDLRGRIPLADDFVGWLRAVVAHRRSHTPAANRTAIESGLAEALAFGTTAIGDISFGGASWPTLRDAPIWSNVYYELLGLPLDRAENSWRDAQAWEAANPDAEFCRKGWSPHAPYSVRSTLIDAALRSNLPVAIHLAESLDELRLLDKRDGPFVEFLSGLGVWEPAGLAESVDWIVRNASRTTPVIFVHGNYLRGDVGIPSNAAVVYCPRTHAAFGHPPHPFREMIRRGVRVALGTDSLASNPDLDLLAEARFIHERQPDVPGGLLLSMATLFGAEALGLGDRTGSIEAGKSADLLVVPLPDRDDADVYRLLLEPDEAARLPRRTIWRGRWR